MLCTSEQQNKTTQKNTDNTISSEFFWREMCNGTTKTPLSSIRDIYDDKKYKVTSYVSVCVRKSLCCFIVFDKYSVFQ